MAAPHIAGIVAQLFQADPSATPAQIEAALKGTTYQFTDGAAYTSVGGTRRRTTRAPAWSTSSRRSGR